MRRNNKVNPKLAKLVARKNMLSVKLTNGLNGLGNKEEELNIENL